jgi:hypothetical protein
LLEWKFHTDAGVGSKEILENCDIRHTSKNPQFLMNGRGLEPIFLNDTGIGLELN